jgi:uncharacterized protein YbjT (DUF2867 family)
MTILVMGGTGQIGSLVVEHLSEQGAEVRVLTQHPEKAKLPPGVSPVKGDGLDPTSTQTALIGVDTVFVLNPVVADELTRALLSLRLAADAGVKGIVYFSMVNSDALVDVPHAAAKFAAERMIETMDLPATILRPNYFFQNDATTKDALLQGIYAMPIGSVGAAMVDIRDIAEIAALELLKRERATGRLPRDLIDISGPEILTANAITAIWTDVLGKPIAYAGDDLDAYAKQIGVYLSAEMVYDITLMLEAWQKIGVLPMLGAVDRLVAMLDRPLRTYRAFAEETAARWQRD